MPTARPYGNQFALSVRLGLRRIFSGDKVRAELEQSDNVTAFAFSERANELAPKGIENLYDEEYLAGFVTTATRQATGESTRNMSGSDKADFANHVMTEGTRDCFRHYGELQQVVQEILDNLGKE